MSGSDGKVTRLEVPAVEVSEGMLVAAKDLRALADAIDAGKVRAVGFCYVEAGPDMYVTRQWASMSGQTTLAGGLYRLLQTVAAD
ncbi:hypothetical protein F3I16_16045 [Pseudomonas sp. L-22-4S-12]|uniref:hypothetical protein n=1 Tax=Pseudomonas sp. L-22-4S-12 TaxID=2610893 RepID=UPI0013214340|nr:hypothetical protein [Pseudomonas sp. L-22-4S-12]MWV17554.1 hypothetical protein [Pseudomonas sp. L-22-4S-12]